VLQGDALSSSGQLQSCIEPGLEGNVECDDSMEVIGPVEIMNGSFC
jgi:hypothetical protein